MIPIIACSIEKTESILILQKSVEIYAPDTKLIIHRVQPSSFGESMNMALDLAFQTYDEVIMSNDDIVITPTSIPTLLEDVAKLKTVIRPNQLGLVATMADNTRPSQNIRLKRNENEKLLHDKWESEYYIKESPVVAPIFAYFSKIAFEAARFPPINWYSDDVICEDLKRLGFKNFVSTAYVHHAGATSIGTNYDQLGEEAMVWVRKHRPEYVEDFEGRKYAK